VENGIVSILNLKNGAGCSCLAWNIAYTLELILHQHDKALHHTYNQQRKNTIDYNIESMLPFTIQVLPIVKNEFSEGVYDLGSDFNYAHTKKIIAKSKAIVIPCELGHETIIKTIATIRFVSELNQKAPIFVVINKLLPLGNTGREEKYTKDAEELISDYTEERVDFCYMRHSFALFRNLNFGFFFLDNYIALANNNVPKKPLTKPFELLQHTRWKIIDTLKNDDKKKEQLEESSFYTKHQQHFQDFIKQEPFEDAINGYFLFQNKRAIKDMLILTTRIKKALEKE